MSLSRLGEPEVGGSLDGYLRSLTAQSLTTQGTKGITATQTFQDGVAGATAISLARADTTTDESGNVLLTSNVTTDYKVGPTSNGFSSAYNDFRVLYPPENGIYVAWAIANSAASGRPVGQVDFAQIPSVNGQPLSGGVAPTLFNEATEFSTSAGALMTSVQVINSAQPRSVWKVQMLWQGGSFVTPSGAATIIYFLGLTDDTTGPIVAHTLDKYGCSASNTDSNDMRTSVYLTLITPEPTTSIALWAISSAPTSVVGSTLNLYLLP